MFLSERIRNLAPAQSNYYRLAIELPDGGSKTFPLDTEAYFRVGDSPYGVPTGKYTVSFFDDQRRALPHNERNLDINLQAELYRNSQTQLSLHGGSIGGAQGTRANEPSDGRLNRQTEVVTPEPEAQAAARPKEPSAEFQQYLQAMELEERQQEFIKSSTYVTEIGELFALNRIMRRELVEMGRLIVEHSKQAYRDIEHVKGISRDFLQLQKEVLASAAENISRPVAPPPDYLGLGASALATVRELGVALINRSGTREPSRPLPDSASAPVAQITARAPEPGAPSSQPKNQAADIIDRIAQKLKSSSEVDIALAMSSPEKWKALLDEVRAPVKEPEGASASDHASNRQSVEDGAR